MTLFGDRRQDASYRSSFSRLFVEPTVSSPPLLDPLFDAEQDTFVVRGYFAFPPPVPEVGDQSCPPVALEKKEHDLKQARQRRDSQNSTLRSESVEKMMEDEDEREVQRLMDERRKRQEKEREMATLGEFEWVRSGGVLRDALGRRDKARTESIRQEIRLQERERLLMDRWETYERKWRALLAADDPVTFKDIPWPTPECPSSVEELSAAGIADFFLEPLEVRTNKTSRRDRIRASLLRWHPDKISSVLSRVVLDDADKVREGVNAVFIILKRMKEL